MKNITYISHNSYIFKGTVRDNLLMGKPDADDKMLWNVLEQVNLSAFLKSENGLDTELTEAGGNLSGGQKQRLALARALLHDSPIYIFDEATSNIDVESENDIMSQIYALAKTKTVILISHRLANSVKADKIYVMEHGSLVESGSHENLLQNHGVYAKLWNTQRSLETIGKEVQSCNHFIAFKLLALIRDKVFGALRKLCPAKLEERDRGDLISVITSDIELLEVFYAHTISPIAIAMIMSVIMTLFIGSYHPILGVIALLAYLTLGCVVPIIISKKNGDSGERFRKNSGDLSGLRF